MGERFVHRVLVLLVVTIAENFQERRVAMRSANVLRRAGILAGGASMTIRCSQPSPMSWKYLNSPRMPSSDTTAAIEKTAWRPQAPDSSGHNAALLHRT
jgi:hypothetical protein